MKYNFKLIRPDINKDDILAINESSIINMPIVGRQTKQHIKNSVQVKFVERFLSQNGNALPVYSGCSLDAVNRVSAWSSTNAYAAENIGGCTVRVIMNPNVSSESDNSLSWLHDPTNYTISNIQEMYVALPFFQDIDYSLPENYNQCLYPIYSTIEQCYFYENDNIDCVPDWVIIKHGDGGIGARTIKLNKPVKSTIRLVFSLFLRDVANNGFACMYPFWYRPGNTANFSGVESATWTKAPNIYSGATDWIYI